MDVRDAEANGNHRDLAERCSGIGLLRVSTRSSPNSVAGAMAGVVRERGSVSVQVVGAGALNQAIKAVAIARSFVEGSDIDLVCVPSFADSKTSSEPAWDPRRLLTLETRMEHGKHRSTTEPAEVPRRIT